MRGERPSKGGLDRRVAWTAKRADYITPFSKIAGALNRASYSRPEVDH